MTGRPATEAPSQGEDETTPAAWAADDWRAAGVLLAVDFGSVRIGVAACDSERILAFPVATVQAKGQPLDDLAQLIDDYQPVAVVVGWPLALDGSESFAAARVRGLVEELKQRVDLPIWLVDERLTTAQAAKRLREAGKDSRRARSRIDASAAVGILESLMKALDQGHEIGFQA